MVPLKIQLELLDPQKLAQRKSRAYIKRCSEDALINEVRNIQDVTKIEQVAIKYDLCDHCDFRGLNSETAFLLIKCVVNVMYKFPKLRSRVCFLGSKAGYINSLQELCKLNKGMINKFQINGICTESSIIHLASQGLNCLDSVEYNDKESNILAQAMNMVGLLDSIILDESDFSGFRYVRLCSRLKIHEARGCVPKNCGSPEYVIYHEIGHMLDYVYMINDSKTFLKYYSGLSNEQISSKVSTYATTSSREFIAECFSEYACSDEPREIARYLVNLIK